MLPTSCLPSITRCPCAARVEACRVPSMRGSDATYFLPQTFLQAINWLVIWQKSLLSCLWKGSSFKFGKRVKKIARFAKAVLSQSIVRLNVTVNRSFLPFFDLSLLFSLSFLYFLSVLSFLFGFPVLSCLFQDKQVFLAPTTQTTSLGPSQVLSLPQMKQNIGPIPDNLNESGWSRNVSGWSEKFLDDLKSVQKGSWMYQDHPIE